MRFQETSRAVQGMDCYWGREEPGALALDLGLSWSHLDSWSSSAECSRRPSPLCCFGFPEIFPKESGDIEAMAGQGRKESG